MTNLRFSARNPKISEKMIVVAPRLPDLKYEQAPSTESISYWAAMASHPRFPLLMRREFYAQGSTTGVHRHTDFRALYVVRRGRGVHQINDQPFAITRGDVYLLGVGARHAYLDFQNLEIDAFYFPPSLWSNEERAVLDGKHGFQEVEPPRAERDTKGIWRRTEPRFHLHPESWRRAEAGIERLRALWCDPTLGADLVLRGAFFAWVWELANALDQMPPIGAIPKRLDLDAAMGEAVRLCDEEFAFDWTVEALAARAFLSPRHFGELFARRTGQSPAAYLRQVRLERGRALLLETNLPIAEVARRTGWNDAAHFSRSFAKKFGAAPRAFRQQQN
ncbi:HTH-type transcriptional activator Btr [Abditibacteriota bacterium]|nr:HTH-type transcriptional activator Btr [Abditibacteriota bacterium]